MEYLRILAAAFHDFQLQHSQRDTNKAAHQLAHQALDIYIDVIVMEDMPLNILLLVLSDVSHLSN